MHFRSNEISIHLMAAGDKDKDKNQEKREKGNKGGPRPGPEEGRIGPGDDDTCGATCTLGTGFWTPKKEASAGTAQGLALLREQLRREAPAAPPL